MEPNFFSGICIAIAQKCPSQVWESHCYWCSPNPSEKWIPDPKSILCRYEFIHFFGSIWLAMQRALRLLFYFFF